VKDSEAPAILVNTILKLASNVQEQKSLSANISSMAMPDAAGLIAEQVFEIALKQKK
jgi:UDP-N-acetylglucosamine:LPS N-acetylglucosamine transferase